MKQKSPLFGLQAANEITLKKGGWVLFSKWLGSPPFISHETAIWKGSHNPIFRGQQLTNGYKPFTKWGFPKIVVPNNYGFSYKKMIILGCFGGTII